MFEDKPVFRFKPVRFLIITGIFVLGLCATALALACFHAMAAPADANNIGLLTLYPESYWETASQAGLARAEVQLEVIGTVYTTTNDEEIILINAEQCASDGNDLCIGSSFVMGNALTTTAAANPAINFALLDAGYNSYLSNMRAILFASDESAYLAGTLAAMMSQSGIIGAIGGMPIPGVDIFIEGYRRGALCANPAVTTIISYTYDFGNPAFGAQTAQDMISNGADVIFAAAGPTGNGAILTATQSGAWAIGVDIDQYASVFMSGTVPGADYLLTSVMKKIDNAVYRTISDQVTGQFTSGETTYGLAEDGVGLAPYHDASPFIPSTVKSRIDWLRHAIISGELDVYGPCLGYKIFLPVTVR